MQGKLIKLFRLTIYAILAGVSIASVPFLAQRKDAAYTHMKGLPEIGIPIVSADIPYSQSSYSGDSGDSTYVQSSYSGTGDVGGDAGGTGDSGGDGACDGDGGDDCG